MDEHLENRTDPRENRVGESSPPRLGVDIYQLANDDVFAANRSDGTGWSWSWADWRRDWMDQTRNRFAYRCLPLTIANQMGWHVYNPVGFTAIWTGRNESDGILFKFDTDPATWRNWVNCQFGCGILTWTVPFLFRTRPAGSRVLITGPANHFKHGAQPLMAMIESDWLAASFTMNWKLTLPGQPVRFDVGEPLFQAIPLAGNAGVDLESADVTYRRVAEDSVLYEEYYRWAAARDAFQKAQSPGTTDPGWQKDYFRGRDSTGRPAVEGHRTKLTPPTVRYLSENSPRAKNDPQPEQRGT